MKGLSKSLTILTLTILGTSLCLAADKSLIERSPFLPANYQSGNKPPPPPKKVTNATTNVAFHGYSGNGPDREFALYDRSANVVYWLKLGVNKNGLKVEAFDESSNEITLANQGRVQRIEIDNAPPPKTSLPRPAIQQNNNTSRATPSQTTTDSATQRRVIPRRRVILPKSN